MVFRNTENALCCGIIAGHMNQHTKYGLWEDTWQHSGQTSKTYRYFTGTKELN